jgi:predicted enzyme related to lactoylglutathione lyase
VIYWAVDDVHDAFERLISRGATVHDEPIERGPGFITASVVDPFGNVLGVMYNQHYLDVLSSRRGE